MLCSTLRIDFTLIIDYEKSIINNSMILVYYLELKTKLVKCNELSYIVQMLYRLLPKPTHHDHDHWLV